MSSPTPPSPPSSRARTRSSRLAPGRHQGGPMHTAGGIACQPAGQTTAATGGPNDVQPATPPAGANAVAFTLESPAIRVTFDGKKPSPKHGLKLSAPEHFFPFAKQMKFASVEQGREAIVNFLWLKLSPKPRG